MFNQSISVDSEIGVTGVTGLCPLHWQAWLNEKFSPELLETKSEVVECVMEQLTHMVNLQLLLLLLYKN